MENITEIVGIETITEIRIYTGSGYEDFVVGEEIKAQHIFSSAREIIRKKMVAMGYAKSNEKTIVNNIEIDKNGIYIEFSTGETFFYNNKSNFRLSF